MICVTGETIPSLRWHDIYPLNWWNGQVDGPIHKVLFRVKQSLAPLDAKVVPPPPVPRDKIGALSLQTEVGNQPLSVEAGSQLLLELLPNCPPGQEKVVMASHGIRVLCG